MASSKVTMDEFMNESLVLWIQQFSTEPVNYTDFCDGVLLNEVMHQIDPTCDMKKVNFTVGEFRERLQNWEVLLYSIQSYYQEVLQQFVIMKPPDILWICKEPDSDKSRFEMQKALLLLLGCAVQCENKELYIDKIKNLDLNIQHDIVEHIKQVTDCPSNIISVELILSGSLEEMPEIVSNHLQRLLKERQESILQVRELMIRLEDLYQTNESQGGRVDGNQVSGVCSINCPHSATELATQMRALRQHLDEKNEEIVELKAELNTTKKATQKLRSENLELVREAGAARAYRDELDIVKDKASRADRFELENAKLREKLVDLEYLKARMDEVRTENGILAESKTELEEQLAIKEKQMEAMNQLEKDLLHFKQQIKTLSEERELGRKKLQELSEENVRLQIEKVNGTSQGSKDVEGETKSFIESSNSLLVQLSDTASIKTLRLELENQRLKRRLENCKDVAKQNEFSKANDLENEIVELRGKLALMEKAKNEELSELRQLNKELMKKNKDREQERTDSESLRMKEIEKENSQLKMAVKYMHEKVGEESETRVQILEGENKQLQADVERLELENRKLLQESKNQNKNVFGEKYSDVEEKMISFQRENEKLLKLVSSLQQTVCKETDLEADNSRLIAEVKCLQSIVENLKRSTGKLAELEQENATLNLHIKQLRKSLDSTKQDKMFCSSLESDLEVALDENAQLKRKLEASNSHCNSLQASYIELEEKNEQMQKSLETLEMASKRFEHVQNENSELEDENRSLRSNRASLERELGKTKQSVEQKAILIDEMGDKIARLENDNKTLKRSIERDVEKIEELVKEIEDLNQLRTADKQTLTTLRQEVINEKVSVQQLEEQLEKITWMKNKSDDVLELEKQSTLKFSDNRIDEIHLERNFIQAEPGNSSNDISQKDEVKILSRVPKIAGSLSARETGRSRQCILDHDLDYNLLKAKLASVNDELSKLQVQHFAVQKENFILKEWKVMQKKLKELQSSSDASTKSEVAFLQNELEKTKQDYVGLMVKHKSVKEELKRTKVEKVEAQRLWNGSKEQMTELYLENHKLTSKCEALSQVNTKMEDEMQMLLLQLQSMMNQNQELLTQILNSKDHFAEEQKTYLHQLADLRRQKEKLEEKIMEQYKQKDATKKKSRGFGAMVRKLVTRSRSTERSKAIPASTSDLSSSFMIQSKSGNIASKSFDNIDQSSSNFRRHSGHRSNSVDDFLKRRESPNDAPVQSQKPRQQPGVKEDEQITLKMFLHECDRSPEARKKLLEEKKIMLSTRAKGNKPQSRSPAATLFGLLSPMSRKSNDLRNSRVFKSEMNISQLSQAAMGLDGSFLNETPINSTADIPCCLAPMTLPLKSKRSSDCSRSQSGSSSHARLDESFGSSVEETGASSGESNLEGWIIPISEVDPDYQVQSKSSHPDVRHPGSNPPPSVRHQLSLSSNVRLHSPDGSSHSPGDVHVHSPDGSSADSSSKMYSSRQHFLESRSRGRRPLTADGTSLAMAAAAVGGARRELLAEKRLSGLFVNGGKDRQDLNKPELQQSPVSLRLNTSCSSSASSFQNPTDKSHPDPPYRESKVCI